MIPLRNNSYSCLTLDPPRGTEHWTPVDSRFTRAVDLVKYIRSSPEFSSHFCIGVAGTSPFNFPLHVTYIYATAYPEGHPDRETDEDGGLDILKEKVDAGADFIVTQLFYDADRFLKWVDKVQEKG